MSVSAALWRSSSKAARVLPLAGRPINRVAATRPFVARANHTLRNVARPLPQRRRAVLNVAPHWQAPSFSSTARLERAAVNIPVHDNSQYVVSMDSFCIAKPGPKKDRPTLACHPDCGEDAYFFCETDTHAFMGVADGVGGWAEVGVDPSVFAWALMGNAHEIALSGKESDVAIILRDAYRRIVDTKSVIAGSSTVCIASLDKQSGVLSCANLGDSGMRLLRNGVTVFQSDVQQHYFNAPYQLSIMPEYMRSDGSLQSDPEDADIVDIQLERGDTILLATDGLYDNLFDHDIEKQLKQHLAGSTSPGPDLKRAVQALVTHAARVAKGESHVSPFSKSARAMGYNVLGGKVDDVCAILASIS